jgi:hypothetical protein
LLLDAGHESNGKVSDSPSGLELFSDQKQMKLQESKKKQTKLQVCANGKGAMSPSVHDLNSHIMYIKIMSNQWWSKTSLSVYGKDVKYSTNQVAHIHGFQNI